MWKVKFKDGMERQYAARASASTCMLFVEGKMGTGKTQPQVLWGSAVKPLCQRLTANVMVAHPKTGNPVRPEISFKQDFLARRIAGFSVVMGSGICSA